ncbi:MAG TPA: sensor histidine kinase [Armatimonadetes bacterium]|jgi:hypothetical protein|nr:sensor histidine kinase [Armatimonadota bacterium]
MRELAEHVLDVAFNSLEAGARRLRIEVTEEITADRIVIRVIDDGRGMDPEEARRIADPFYTTRATRRVGLGIPLLAEAARACEGGLEVRSRPGEGTTVTAWLRASHVDRQPMGDMAATLVTLIAAAPMIDLEYQHGVDGHRFTFSTAQARELAGETSLAHPAVARWLREYLEEHLHALGEGRPGSVRLPAIESSGTPTVEREHEPPRATLPQEDN